MKFYMAPLEGITGYVFRSTWNKHFGNIDRYYTPFISPNENRGIGPKEQRDILPAHNAGMTLIPQILTNKAEQFITAARELEAYGYTEVNLNLGCPSGTVVSKHRGAGLLADLNELNLFLEEIFRGSPLPISIKTRTGMESHNEFARILGCYAQYPVKELIVHPRVRSDFYRNQPNMNAFEEAVRCGIAPLCYNGDLFHPKDYRAFCERFPMIDAVMIGRGLLADPGLIDALRKGMEGSDILTDKTRIKAYHDDLLGAYAEIMPGDRVVLFKMKELWVYLHTVFSENEKYWKKIRKANRLWEYKEAVSRIFEEQEILPYRSRVKPGQP